MIDIIRFMYPNASDESIISGSNFFVLMGWCFIFIGASGLVVESIGQRRLFYEAFPLIILGIFFMEVFGMHANFSYWIMS